MDNCSIVAASPGAGPDMEAATTRDGCAQDAAVTVYFDGACPLCSREIAHYRRVDAACALGFVDVAAENAPVPAGLSHREALARFHVRLRDGHVLSGAAAFVAVWTVLPGWRWAARIARLPGVPWALELGYRCFLPLRPRLAHWLLRVAQARSVDTASKG